MHRRLAAALATPALALVGVLGTATAADAAPADKPQVLASWTQTSASSYNQWAAARANQGAWAAYQWPTARRSVAARPRGRRDDRPPPSTSPPARAAVPTSPAAVPAPCTAACSRALA